MDKTCNGISSETTELVTVDNWSDCDNRDNTNYTQTILSNSPSYNSLFMILEKQVKDIRKALYRMEMKFEERKYQETEASFIMREWKAIGMILDRFFFCVYLLLITLSLVFMFPRPESWLGWFLVVQLLLEKFYILYKIYFMPWINFINCSIGID